MMLQDLQGLPGQRILNAEDEAGPEPGQGGAPPAGPVLKAPKPLSGYAALVDLCWDRVSNAAQIPWQLAPKYPQP